MASDEGRKFVDEVAKSIKNSSGVEVVFGKPVDKDGITVIPVARIKGGGGGGFGSGPKNATKKQDTGEGLGFGFGVDCTPYGYIEIKDGRAEYKKIKQAVDKKTLVIGGTMLALATLIFVSKNRRENRRAQRLAVYDEAA